MANAHPVLDGRWVRLEPLGPAHVAPLSRVALDPELWRWTVSQVRTEADLRRYVEAALDAAAQGHAVPFAIFDRASGAAAGSTRFGNIDPHHRRLEIGWTWLGRAFQRTALNTETKYLMLRHAFEGLGCIRVEFKTDVLNARSREAIRRLGAVEEGVLRHHMITESGRVRDTVYYSILAAEWPAVRERLEARLAR
ncbi:MAG: GNAT family N-acetyltransferase [Gemmatimonadales bacterium]